MCNFEVRDGDGERGSAKGGGDRLGVVALVLAVLGVGTVLIGVGIVFAILAIGVGMVAKTRNRQSVRVVRERSVNFAIGLGIVSVLLGTVIICLPSLGRREMPNRTYCAFNLKAVAASMTAYSADNGNVFPVLPFAEYGVGNGKPSEETAVGLGQGVHALYAAGAPLKGSPMANMWMLVQLNYVTPKQFVCKSDPYAVGRGLAEQSPGVVYLNFQKGDQLSYGFSYPYTKEGEVGAWWKNCQDEKVAVASDMPPMNGTGRPARDVAPGGEPVEGKSWNSPNHGFEGENVAFADGHAEFVRRPDVGQEGDNIFTVTGEKKGSRFGGRQPGFSGIEIGTEVEPFDVVVVPARNLDTGGI